MVLGVFALLAIPFWAMTISSEGFYGRYSTQVADVREEGSGVPYMQPYPISGRVQHTLAPLLPALNFAAILEDKDKRDLVSRMRFAESDIGRDWFLLGAHAPCTSSLQKYLRCQIDRILPDMPHAIHVYIVHNNAASCALVWHVSCHKI